MMFFFKVICKPLTKVESIKNLKFLRHIIQGFLFIYFLYMTDGTIDLKAFGLTKIS